MRIFKGGDMLIRYILLLILILSSQAAAAQTQDYQSENVSLIFMDRDYSADYFEGMTDARMQQEVMNIVFWPLLKNYAEENNLEPSEEEVKEYTGGQDAIMSKKFESWTKKKEDLERRLQSPDYTRKQKQVFTEQKDKFALVLYDLAKAHKISSAGDQSFFVMRWKINKSLYEKYGGRVSEKQQGPEPIDAYIQFLKMHEEKGTYKIYDAHLMDLLWEYLINDENHKFFPEDEAQEAMQTPYWLKAE